MLTYIARRALMAIPILLGIATITFLLNFVFVPGDPVRISMGQHADPETIEMIREELGLNDPLYMQYFKFVGRLVTGDLGESFSNGRPVINMIKERVWATAKLTLAAMGIAVILGVTAGVISAVFPNTWLDYIFMTLAMLGVSMPVYWLGLLMIWLFALNLNLLPVGGYGDGSIVYLILPAFALGLRQAARVARITRSSMLEVINKDYIKTARAKGVKEKLVIMKHGLRNALIPVVTSIGTQVGFLMGGAVLTERTFSWPGLGRLAVDAVLKRDFPLIQGTVLFLAAVFVVVLLLVDISYAFLDPRIRYN